MNFKNVMNRLKDETLDLSLCDLEEVPVREIAVIKRATHLDLSSNLLTSLPSTFMNLKHVVELDLSRNMLTEIPENFGELKQLRHLDLYANQISRLPLSLGELKNLRWLDLKENPLTPAVASVAGPCSNTSECEACARNIVNYLSQVKRTIQQERLRRLNAITADAEAETASAKKGAKKKKKGSDKSSKESVVKNGSDSLNVEASRADEKKAKPATSTRDKNVARKEPAFTGSVYRLFATAISWLLLLSLAFTLAIVILPVYFKQSEVFIEYVETSTGVRLKAFRKHSAAVLSGLAQAAIDVYEKARGRA